MGSHLDWNSIGSDSVLSDGNAYLTLDSGPIINGTVLHFSIMLKPVSLFIWEKGNIDAGI